jgi:hypothetical protein
MDVSSRRAGILPVGRSPTQAGLSPSSFLLRSLAAPKCNEGGSAVKIIIIMAMRARIGKIARLPGNVRNELNRRLHNGAFGKDLVPWLNTLPEVTPVLAARFAGRPITEDNISEWRRGGFQDWLREKERRVRLRELTAEYHDGDPEEHAAQFDAHLQQRLVLELTEELERLSTLTDRTERFKCLIRLSREYCRVQRSRNRGLEIGLFHTKAQVHSNPFSQGLPPIGASRAFSDKRPRGEGGSPRMPCAPPAPPDASNRTRPRPRTFEDEKAGDGA